MLGFVVGSEALRAAEIPRDVSPQAGRANAFAATPALVFCGSLASAERRKGYLPPCKFSSG